MESNKFIFRGSTASWWNKPETIWIDWNVQRISKEQLNTEQDDVFLPIWTQEVSPFRGTWSFRKGRQISVACIGRPNINRFIV